MLLLSISKYSNVNNEKILQKGNKKNKKNEEINWFLVKSLMDNSYKGCKSIEDAARKRIKSDEVFLLPKIAWQIEKVLIYFVWIWNVEFCYKSGFQEMTQISSKVRSGQRFQFLTRCSLCFKSNTVKKRLVSHFENFFVVA